MDLLKEHMNILEKLTGIASKETKFEERGQFLNVQKMVQYEIDIINDLKKINNVEAPLKFNVLDFYKFTFDEGISIRRLVSIDGRGLLFFGVSEDRTHTYTIIYDIDDLLNNDKFKVEFFKSSCDVLGDISEDKSKTELQNIIESYIVYGANKEDYKIGIYCNSCEVHKIKEQIENMFDIKFSDKETKINNITIGVYQCTDINRGQRNNAIIWTNRVKADDFNAIGRPSLDKGYLVKKIEIK